MSIIRNKNQNDVSSTNTVNSVSENEDSMRQRYSISNHPTLPIFICSDGYLTCVFSFKPAFIDQSRLLREFSHEATRLSNSILPDKHRKLKVLSKTDSKSSLNLSLKIPDWGLEATIGTNGERIAENSSCDDSGVENDKKSKPSITEGKIIFSYIPQILPISFEKLETNSISSKIDALYEITQNSWNLLSSSYVPVYTKFDYEPTINTIKQLLSSYTNIIINLNYANFIELNLVKNNLKVFKNLKQLFNDDAEEFEVAFEECKLKVLLVLFLNFFKILNFDATEYHMFIHIPKILNTIIDNLFKNETQFKSLDRTQIFQTVFVFLGLIRSFLCDIYKFNVNEQLFVNIDQVIEQAKVCRVPQKLFTVELSNKKLAIINRNDTIHEEFNFDQQFAPMGHQKANENNSSVDYIMEFGWKALLKYTTRFHKKLSLIKAKNFIIKSKISSLGYLLILIERNLKSYNQIYSINNGPLMKLNSGDELYYNGNLDAALSAWKTELNKLLLSDRHQHKCLKIAHKIFYSCISNYELKKFILILNDYLVNNLATNSSTIVGDESEYSDVTYNEQMTRLNLNLNTFTKLDPPKSLYISHPAIIYLLESFARFMALYFMNKTKLIIYTVNNPSLMPNIIDICENAQESNKENLKIEILNQKLTNKLKNDQYLQKIFNIDKTLELLLVCGLYNEAIYFTYSINDWKSTFLLSSILKEVQNGQIVRNQEYLPDHIKSENLLTNKLCSILNLDLSGNNVTTSSESQSKLFDKAQTESLNKILKDLLLCSVVTKVNVLSPLVKRLLDILVFTVSQLSAIIDREFYLPAPPIYCTQMMTEDDIEGNEAKQECILRLRLSNLTKCIIQLLQSSNLHVPLIKWYLQELNNSSLQMNTNIGIGNLFYVNNQLTDLLKSIRYQKLGYIPVDVMLMFRDFCAILFFLDTRDKFSHLLRRYTKSMMNNKQAKQNQQEIDQLCYNIVEYGNLMLSFRGFLKHQHVEIQDIILSSIARLTSRNVQILSAGLERKLATCVDKAPFMVNSKGGLSNEEISESFQSKLDNLLEKWKTISGQFNTTLADLYHEHISTKRATTVKLLTMFGLPEDVLIRVYLQKLPRSEPNLVGSYDYERSNLCTEFLEIFFKVGFNASESWENFVQSTNITPLLPEFYEIVRSEHLPNGPPDKSYILTQSPATRRLALNNQKNFKKKLIQNHSLIKEENEDDEEEIENSNRFYRGLFRKYEIISPRKDSKKDSLKNRSASLTDLRASNSSNKLRKTVSFFDLSSSKIENVISKNISLNDDIFVYGENAAEIQLTSVGSIPSEDTIDNFSSYKVLDYGTDYEKVTHLAIWLMKWTKSFNMIVKESKITYKIQSINANMLVGTVFLADNLDLISYQAKTQRGQSVSKKIPNATNKQVSLHPKAVVIENDGESNFTSDDLTDVTNSIMPQKPLSKPNQMSPSFNQFTNQANLNDNNNNNNNNSEQQSASSTLDISSLDEQEEMLLRQLQDTGSQMSKTPSPTKPRITALDDYSNFTNITETKMDNIQQQGRPIVEEYFRQSPVKTPNYFDTKQFSIKSQPNDYLQPLPQMLSTDNSNMPIADMIRDELKKIVQLQHDTIMNVLNGGNQMQQQQMQSLNNNQFGFNMEKSVLEQLKYVSSMNKNGEPVEFIIETKVKTAQNGLESQNKNENKSYFMKTFDYNKTEETVTNRQRSPDRNIKKNPLGMPLLFSSNKDSQSGKIPALPLIKEAWTPKQYAEPFKNQKTGFNFPLLTIKSRKDRSKSPSKDHHGFIPVLKEKSDSNVADAIRMLKNLTVKSSTQQANPNIKLLTLQNPNTKSNRNEIEDQTNKISHETTDKADVIPTRETKQPVQMVHKEVEVEKPLYDGYILKPEAFEEMLPKEKGPIDASSAEAHYHATQHLRDELKKQAQTEKYKNRKDTFTMTDNLSNVNNLAPDILFKLKFDPMKKGREAHKNDFERDFVNVADLNSDAVEDMLKLIENEQNKRTGTLVIASRPAKPTVIVTIPEKEKEEEIEQSPLKADALTEKLLKDEEKLNYDLMHENILSSNARSKSRQTVLNEFKIMDEKIKIMNDIAGEIGNDYQKYNKIVDTIQDFNKILDMTHEYPIGSKDVPRMEEIVKMEEEEKENERKKTKFYNKKDAEKKIEEAIKKQTLVSRKEPSKMDKEVVVDDDADLSELKADEEERLKKILNLEPMPAFDSTDLEQTLTGRQIEIPTPAKKSPAIARKTRQQIEVEQRKIKNKERMESAKHRRENKIATASSKSPTRRDIQTPQATPRLNTTYKKLPTSNLVQMERENAEKRDLMHQQFMEVRAREAQRLMKDIIIDNAQDVGLKKDTNSLMIDLRRTHTIGDEQKKQPKVDLMTKTILQLQRNEEMKRIESKNLLDELEERALKDDKKSKEPKEASSPDRAQVKTIKSFNHYVHLQEPEKLKHNPVNPPLTYSERLQLHQEEAISKPSANEIFKIYGTKRVPGIYKSYVKETPRKVKTYQERVRELKPSTVYVKQPTKIPIRIPKKRTGTDIRKGKTYGEQLKELQSRAANKTFIVSPSPFKKPNTQKRHDLQPKSRIEYKKKEQNRFKPYSSPYIEYPDELSPWSMDDNMKHILYDEPSNRNKSIRKRVSYKEQDQETLADTDDYLQMFPDEPNQKEIDKLIRDIDNEKDYTESVHIDDLMNIVSLSTESNTISYVDWDQVERILVS